MSLSNFSFSSRHTKCGMHWSNHGRPLEESQQAQRPKRDMLSDWKLWSWLGGGLYLAQIQLLQPSVTSSTPCSKLDPRAAKLGAGELIPLSREVKLSSLVYAEVVLAWEPGAQISSSAAHLGSLDHFSHSLLWLHKLWAGNASCSALSQS